jgi:hypothetical protein
VIGRRQHRHRSARIVVEQIRMGIEVRESKTIHDNGLLAPRIGRTRTGRHQINPEMN